MYVLSAMNTIKDEVEIKVEDEPDTCLSEEEKIEWVTAINVEVKDLKFFAKRLSQEFSSSLTSLITI